MSVTGASRSSRDLLEQVDRVASSDLLRSSESLCRLLRYLADHFLNSPGTPIKEYQIATEVFGRPSDFDPRLDSTVRVQTGRLRSKLAEYYAGPGAEDRMLIEIPKGSYTISIHERTIPDRLAAVAEAAPHPARERASGDRPSNLIASVWALGVVSLMLLVALVIALARRPTGLRASAESPDPAVGIFWHGFTDGPDRPWVVFSNAAFVGRPETGMRYFDPRRDAGAPILDHYTGVGEVLAIHELDKLFRSLDHGIRVKRGRLLSLDDVESNDVIFVGSPSENLSLREVPGTQDFVFRLSESAPRKGDLEIVNVRPQPGEPPTFWRSATIPIQEDHAVIALFPGINSARRVMILAGTTTIGTQAAAEYVTRTANLADLVNRVGVKDGGILPFEAVIRVHVASGVPVSSELVALRSRNERPE